MVDFTVMTLVTLGRQILNLFHHSSEVAFRSTPVSNVERASMREEI
jgi:hypothetical protein